MRDRGIHIREGFPCFLTTSHTDEDIAKIVLAFKESAIEMQEAGFLTARADLTSNYYSKYRSKYRSIDGGTARDLLVSHAW